MSIKDFGEKIKGQSRTQAGKDLYIVITLVVVAVASFGLGRLSMASKSGDQVQLVYPRGGEAAAVQALPNTVKSNTSTSLSSTTKGEATVSTDTLPKQIVASSKGTKYYYIWCSGAKSLSEANKIYFATEEEAEAKGYSKSTSCK